jgi:nucleoside-diphosphate-sugar epimerase
LFKMATLFVASGASLLLYMARSRNQSHKSKKVFIFGLGYTGSRVAKMLVEEGWDVTGTVRNGPDIQNNSIIPGVRVVLYDSDRGSVEDELTRCGGIDALKQASHILITLQTGEDGDLVLPQLVAPLIESQPKWVGYLSTVGVYGEHHGAWVNECSDLRPDSARSRKRVLAEEDCHRQARAGLPVHIFRLPGIYGPGRGPIEKVRAGRARRLLKQGQVFNRIHVDDIAASVIASMRKPMQPQNQARVYNIADDLPVEAHVVIEHACELLGKPLPPLQVYQEVESELSVMVRSFYKGSKRVDNFRMKTELGVKLLYPTYIEGNVAQLLEEQQQQRNDEHKPPSAPAKPNKGTRTPRAPTPGTSSRRTKTHDASVPTSVILLVDNGQ